ncbi:MAG: hypothetical protein H8E00_00930 [Deltaproteobacteria bacterium]|nr:hypothetical protein [Deltaproteobacteria bacterium]
MITKLIADTPITWSTINDGVATSAFFAVVLYGIVVGVALLASIYFVYFNKSSFWPALRKGVLISTLAAGFFYAIWADTIWCKWLVTDIKQFWGLDTNRRLEKVFGDRLYPLIRKVKYALRGDDYVLYSSGPVGDLLVTEYHLLPSRLREDASFIFVFGDNDAKFYPHSGVLTRGNSITENLDMYFFMYPSAYILRKKQ